MTLAEIQASSHDSGNRPRPALLGLWVFLASVAMLFAAFTSAYLVRSATAGWVTTRLPATVWLSTVLILASSWSLRGLGTATGGLRRRLDLTLASGTAFLVSQIVAWGQLVARGVYAADSAHAAFFYLISALHAAHVIGGLAFLAVCRRRASAAGRVPTAATALSNCATYWHFMTGLWVFLLILLLRG